MTIMQQNLTIHMIRTDLSGLPHFDLPPGFALRWYKPGDDRTWCRIHLAADRYNPISPDLFHGEFGWDDARLQARQCYLLSPDGGAVGTATAWLDDDYYGERYGRIHWVAILPDWQGRGLAKPLLSSACARLQESSDLCPICVHPKTARYGGNWPALLVPGLTWQRPCGGSNELTPP